MSGASIAAEVAAAIREVGRDTGAGALVATLIRPAVQPVNPWDTPAGAPSMIPVAVMVERFAQALVDGTLIRAEDRKVMMEATGTTPTTADRLKIGTDEYAILSVMPEAPGGVALYFSLHCRK
jgi:hypothetical protein